MTQIVGGGEIISVMIYPFFFLCLAWLMNERKKIVKNNSLHDYFFVFFIGLGMFVMFIPLTVLDIYFNYTAPYNQTQTVTMGSSILALAIAIILFMMLTLVFWIIKLIHQKEDKML